MKNILKLLLVCIGIFSDLLSVNAQNPLLDKIILKDSMVIEAKINKVTENLIYYQQSGENTIHNFEIKKDQVAQIVYGNGHIEIISQIIEKARKNKADIVNSEKPWLQKYFINNLRHYNPETLLSANNFYKNKIRNIKQTVVTTAVLGTAMSISGGILLKQSQNQDDIASELIYGTGGIVLFVGGAACAIVGTTVGSHTIYKYKKKSQFLLQELHRRDIGINQLKIYPILNPRSKAVGFGLAYHF